MRDFERTQEPRGASKPAKLPKAAPGASFVVQKHDARNLHYDFRLELDGVLLSWAVPKGPSLDPTVKRLAMEVEPHPVEYGGFEGIIPKGEYGGGTVMVWDRGTWTPESDPHQGLAKGRLDFSLHGQKLKGRWHLVRTRGMAGGRDGKAAGKGWLLFKSRDAESREQDTLLEDEPNSALSGREMAQIAADAGEPAPDSSKRRRAPSQPESSKAVAKSGKATTKPSKKAVAKSSKREPSPPDPEPSPRRADKTAAKPRKKSKIELPPALAPELATLVDEAPTGDDWVHEIKLDGYRILARLDNGNVTLLTRSGKDWTERMPSLRDALERLNVGTAFFDGELVALNPKGVSDFQALQNSLKEGGDAALVYYVFDLLYDDSGDLRNVPLLERKSKLRELLESQSSELAGKVRFSAHVVGSGREFFENACKLGLEGTIAKRGASSYSSGRGRDWLKIKCTKRQEFTIVGFTQPGGSRSHFGALLLGTRRDGRDQLVYAGKVGTGFTEASLAELHEKLGPFATPKPQLSEPPRGAEARGVTWVEPKLVAEIGFTELTSEGLLRHPTFQGLRDDKPAREVVMETAEPARAPAARKSTPAARTTAPAARKTGAPAPSGRASEYPLTHPDKVLYPKVGVTKRELLEYYELVSDRMLPHVANRPLTLVRCPNGQGKPCFFQKHPGPGEMPGLRSITIREKEGKSPYSVIDDVTGLFGLVQLGALEIHTWGSRADDFERPDTLVFDFDPDEAVEYAAVIRAAQAVRQVFEQAKLKSFVKTTGGKGLHVCIPIAPDLGWDQVKDFTGRIAEAMAARSPELYVATQSKAKRKGKIFIDYLRNGRGATFIAPYSARNRDSASIAVPLEWDELSPKLPPDHFNVRNIQKRLARLSRDPFEELAQLEQHLKPQGVKT